MLHLCAFSDDPDFQATRSEVTRNFIKVWETTKQLSNQNIVIPRLDSNSFEEILASLHSKLNQTEFNALVFTWWVIWLQRNRAIFDQVYINSTQTPHLAHRSFQEWRLAMSNDHKGLGPQTIKRSTTGRRENPLSYLGLHHPKDLSKLILMGQRTRMVKWQQVFALETTLGNCSEQERWIVATTLFWLRKQCVYIMFKLRVTIFVSSNPWRGNGLLLRKLTTLWRISITNSGISTESRWITATGKLTGRQTSWRNLD